VAYPACEMLNWFIFTLLYPKKKNLWTMQVWLRVLIFFFKYG